MAPRSLDLLFEDEDYVAVMKPAGIPVHGGAKLKTATVLQRMPPGLVPVHRLDQDTSGVLVLAKSSDAAQRARSEWERATKIYWAVVAGDLRGEHRIDVPLRGPDGRAQSARTEVRDLARSDNGFVSLVEARLGTGRTHQIRKHLLHVGHPVVMDDRYGDFGLNREFRQRVRAAGAANPKTALLHARRLVWFRGTIDAPVPQLWKALLQAVDGALADALLFDAGVV